VIARTSGGGIDANIVKLGEILRLSTSAGNIHANIPFSEGMDLDIKGNRIKSDKLYPPHQLHLYKFKILG
jgi:hypothetical protein